METPDKEPEVMTATQITKDLADWSTRHRDNPKMDAWLTEFINSTLKEIGEL